MPPRRSVTVLGCLVASMLALFTASLLYSPGTADVGIWRDWISNARAHGVVGGYQSNMADYPPFAAVILTGADRVLQPFGIGWFGVVKLSILALLSLTTLVTWAWTRSPWMAATMHASLLLNSLMLGFLDVYFAPTLILSLWA